jgi:crossover junction endodeoxyribonuclease RusA
MTDDTLLPWPASLTGTGRCFIPGTPTPQGSHKAYIVGGFAKITDDNPKTKPWRADIHAAVREVTGTGIVFPTEPVALSMVFVMPRRAAERKHPAPHTRKPDSDKLVRAVLDALAGLIYTRDQQVTDIRASKRTARIGETPGAQIEWRHDG